MNVYIQYVFVFFLQFGDTIVLCIVIKVIKYYVIKPFNNVFTNSLKFAIFVDFSCRKEHFANTKRVNRVSCALVDLLKVSKIFYSS